MPRSGSAGADDGAPAPAAPLPARRRRAPSRPLRLFVAAALLGGAAAALLVARPRLGAWVALESPETQVRAALARVDRLRVSVPGSSAAIELAPVRFTDVVAVAEGGRASAVALVEADGHVRSDEGDVALAYVGRERLRLARCRASGWCAEGAPLDRLAGVVAALLVRTGGRGAPPLAWQVRVERDRAEVGEDVGDAAAAGAGARGRRLYRLERQGERWVFTGG